MALIMTVYNMKRAMNIMGIEKLLEKLKEWKPDYAKATFISSIRAISRRFEERYFFDLAGAA